MKQFNGLILVGGKSSRMGTDKSLLKYHKKTQREYLYELLSQYTENVFFSCRENQIIQSDKIIYDQFPSNAPISGVLSALSFNPQIAWLVVACDMPLIDESVIDLLIKNRKPDKIATAFFNSTTQAPDPLLAIYEPSCFELLRSFFESGKQSLKFFLQENDTQLIHTNDEIFLKNINHPTEFEEFVKIKT